MAKVELNWGGGVLDFFVAGSSEFMDNSDANGTAPYHLFNVNMGLEIVFGFEHWLMREDDDG